jgi:hypothetical protein
VPAPGDEDLFTDFIFRERGFGEEDLSDKPEFIREGTPNYGVGLKSVEEADERHRNQLRSLQAVDRAVGAILDKIEEKGVLNQTVFFFTSDNGYMWGEHGRYSKGLGYEESIRVPLVVVMPGIQPRYDDHMVVMNLDIVPTIYDLIGISRETDGLSLYPLLQDSETLWREEILIQRYNRWDKSWAGLVVKTAEEEWKYIESATGEKELYDLLYDPFEMDSQQNDPAYQDMIAEFSMRLRALKGLNIITKKAPKGVLGEEYTFQLTAWGGKEPYTWSIIEGQLPEGLSLESASGIIYGFPVKPEDQKLMVMVEDSSIAKQTGNPQSFYAEYRILINE